MDSKLKTNTTIRSTYVAQNLAQCMAMPNPLADIMPWDEDAIKVQKAVFRIEFHDRFGWPKVGPSANTAAKTFLLILGGLA